MATVKFGEKDWTLSRLYELYPGARSTPTTRALDAQADNVCSGPAGGGRARPLRPPEHAIGFMPS